MPFNINRPSARCMFLLATVAATVWGQPNRQGIWSPLANWPLIPLHTILTVDGRLLTCPMPDGGLPGITREAVLEIASASALPFDEIPLPVPLLAAAQEAFLTNTSWEVLPIVRVDTRTIGAGRPGPVTGDLLARYRGLMRDECGARRIDGASVSP